MEERELLLKIENLEKRVSLLEKQLETISQINQSEKASKIAKLLDVAAEKNPNDSQIENIAISDVLSSSPIMEKIDTAKDLCRILIQMLKCKSEKIMMKPINMTGIHYLIMKKWIIR